MTRRLLCAALALAALAGMPPAATPADPASAALPGDADGPGWQERIAEARRAVEQAQRRRETADAAVQRMRHRRKPRGDAREALFAERDEARAAQAQAERDLEALLEEARRAGVPPGWLAAEEPAPADASE
jgi:hypothetical protein